MEKIIQFLVANQTDAYKVIDTLRDLDNKADISLAASYVLEKDNNGKVSLKDSRGFTADNTLFGSFAGGLMGLFAGPFGFLMGISFGALFGSLIDWSDSDKKEQYLNKISEKIPNGKLLVVAHIYEDWTEPIDSSLSSIAEISRVNVDEEVDKAIQKEIDDYNKEIDETEAAMKAAVDADKEKLQQKLNDLKSKKATIEAQLKAKLETQKQAYKNWFTKAKDKIKSFAHI